MSKRISSFRSGFLLRLGVFLTVVSMAGAGVLLSNSTVNLGLDLQGGISAIYGPVFSEGERPDDERLIEALDETVEVIRTRIDALGVAEPTIARQGEHVLIQLPGASDSERLRDLIGTTARLTLRPVIDILPPDHADYDFEGPDCEDEDTTLEELPDNLTGFVCQAESGMESQGIDRPAKFLVGPVAVEGERISDAVLSIGESAANHYAVRISFDGEGSRAFEQFSSQLACERDEGRPGAFAIVIDNEVISAPGMDPAVACGRGITGGNALISMGSSDRETQKTEAENLALLLRAGALPLTLEPSTFETVSPTLGASALQASLLAAVIGLLGVAAWLIFFYRRLGVVAVGALVVFSVLTYASLVAASFAGFALTLAGVAGLIVSLGITADSSILFLERIRDEVRSGRTVRTALPRAFSSAFRTNLTGNMVTLAAAVILYFLAIGPVRGFALVLGFATVLDILIMHFFTRPAVFALDPAKLTAKTLRVERKDRSEFPFFQKRRIWFKVSTVLAAGSVLSIVFAGLTLSLDFTGGTSYSLEGIDAAVTSTEISQAASEAGALDPRVQMRGTGEGASALVTIEAVDPGSALDVAISQAIVEVSGALAITESFVGPTWGSRLTSQALWALGIFLVVITLYISFRLEFRMAMAALIALGHDLLITLGVYALSGFNFSPATVIALLTVLGYSLYDSVVVFDRTKEEFNRETGPRRLQSSMVNTSLNKVAWRSVSTSVTSILPVAALLFLGSGLLGADTLTDLSLALFVGMLVGIYSSLFVAGPVFAHWMSKKPSEVAFAKRIKRAQNEAADKSSTGHSQTDKTQEASTVEEVVSDSVEDSTRSELEDKPFVTEYVRGPGKTKRSQRRKKR